MEDRKAGGFRVVESNRNVTVHHLPSLKAKKFYGLINTHGKLVLVSKRSNENFKPF